MQAEAPGTAAIKPCNWDRGAVTMTGCDLAESSPQERQGKRQEEGTGRRGVGSPPCWPVNDAIHSSLASVTSSCLPICGKDASAFYAESAHLLQREKKVHLGY